MAKNLAEVFEDWGNQPLSSHLFVLRSIRKAAGLTLREVSEMAGVSISYLSQLERGKYSTVRIDTLSRIAEACGCFLRVEIINAKENIFYGVH